MDVAALVALVWLPTGNVGHGARHLTKVVLPLFLNRIQVFCSKCKMTTCLKMTKSMGRLHSFMHNGKSNGNMSCLFSNVRTSIQAIEQCIMFFDLSFWIYRKPQNDAYSSFNQYNLLFRQWHMVSTDDFACCVFKKLSRTTTVMSAFCPVHCQTFLWSLQNQVFSWNYRPHISKSFTSIRGFTFKASTMQR